MLSLCVGQPGGLSCMAASVIVEGQIAETYFSRTCICHIIWIDLA